MGLQGWILGVALLLQIGAGPSLAESTPPNSTEAKMPAPQFSLVLHFPADETILPVALTHIDPDAWPLAEEEEEEEVQDSSETLSFEPPVSPRERLRNRFHKIPLLRYKRSLTFGNNDVLMKIRAPGKRKSIMSVEFKF